MEQAVTGVAYDRYSSLFQEQGVAFRADAHWQATVQPLDTEPNTEGFHAAACVCQRVLHDRGTPAIGFFRRRAC